MRITKISVTGLFGLFNHEIPLNQESQITIIHGPNGVGKTVLMQLVHGLFHYEYEYIASIPFEQLQLEYDDGNILTVEKEVTGDGEEQSLRLHINYMAVNGEKHCPFVLEIVGRVRLIEAAKKVRPDLIAVLLSNGRLIWAPNIGSQTIEEWQEKQIDRLFEGGIERIDLLGIMAYSEGNMLESHPEIHNEIYGEMPEWFQTARTGPKTKLISASRLLRDVAGKAGKSRWDDVDERDTIRALGQFFAPRDEVPILFLPGIRGTVEEVERFFNHYVDSGISIHKSAIEELRRFQAEDSYPAQLLHSDIERRIEEHEDELDGLIPSDFYRSEELAELLNERFLFKSFVVDDDEYTVTLVNESDRARIPFSALSSGEQQLLILYYQLVVKTDYDSLVMLDEPELSMNVVWQRNFLKDLQRIIELRKFDVLIATHSPQIIHDKWDWMVPLGEKAGD